MSWGFDDLISSVGDWFGGAADAAGGVVDSLPLPPEFLTEDAASALGGAADAGGGGFPWGSVLGGIGTVVRAATPIAGALMGTSANSSAARTQSQATSDAARIQAEALLRAQQMGIDATREAQDRQEAAGQRGIAAIRAGTQGYADTIAPLLVERPISLPAYRGLTEAQQIGRADIRRNSLATLSASGLRGAGRAGVATVMDADRRYVANAVDQNDNRRIAAAQAARASADNARSGLASARAQEGGAIANTEIGQGNRMAETGLQGARTAADLTGTIGGVNSQAALSQGQISAGSDIANAGLWGDALGTLGSVIAGYGKSANSDRYSATDRGV